MYVIMFVCVDGQSDIQMGTVDDFLDSTSQSLLEYEFTNVFALIGFT